MPALLEVDSLTIDARKDDGSLAPIVKGVSFGIERGEVVALIGESGSGKTTIALSALGYSKPGLEFTGGEVRLDGRDVISMPPDEKRSMRGPARRLSRPERGRHIQSRSDHRRAGDRIARSPRPDEP